jgi:uncharacterized protein (TIGR02147 family)
MTRKSNIDVFDYLDYRAFLRDFYTEGKTRRSLSFRAFSRRAGLKSTNYLKLVMDGDRNLAPNMAERFAAACGLEDEEKSYFVELVRFNQAQTSTHRNEAYTRLSGFRRYQKAHKLDLAHAAYHASWYIPAIRELAARSDFVADPAWVASALLPPISVTEAKSALHTLADLGLLVENDEGRLVQAEALVTTGPEIQRVHIANYHRVMLERAAASIDEIAPADRDISSLTLAVGDSGLRRLKERLQRFRRELLELSALEDDPAQVVQINFQLFPLSRAKGDGS